ncbi:hypothetical protein [Cyclobacterium qasimii]|uniref:Uncharacterized protein n=1 Tax=Cyclobacterium qasimii M12-11B TaxID=641524 RepID=S7WGS5_9BACT|nr:hypothetical protein [Cyclobacterium qasimii]EPR65964.1 hypothetical protein ADICYQ_5109 [Cyclobacterium qasimii M12-11B]
MGTAKIAIAITANEIDRGITSKGLKRRAFASFESFFQLSLSSSKTIDPRCGIGKN